MRIPTYLSYSSFSLFEKNEEEFYLKHLADTRPARLPQERPASVGSAFDAYAKSALHEALYGPGNDPKYEFPALFEAQVEKHNRDWALEEGRYIFECYKVAGAYDTLLGLLKLAIKPPRFEFEVRAEILGVPFLGKPDCQFILPGPVEVVHDFKVNGYCAKSGTSPVKGYMICNDGFQAANGKQNKSHGQAHKQFRPIDVHGYTIDEGCLEDCDTGWADQLSMYGWALGQPIGGNTVLSIDQIVAKPVPEGRPLLRVSSYRARVRKSYQEHLANRLKKCWEVVQSGHIFRDMSREDSDARMSLLDGQAMATQGGTPEDDFFNTAVRAKYRG
jgi:hypothetical protein